MVRKLSPELCEVARVNCNEHQELIADYIKPLQAWIKKSPHLKAPTDEQLLLAFLRRCSFSLEECKKRIDAYYSLKNYFPEVLCNRMINDAMMELYRQGVYIIPKEPMSPTGARLIISQYAKHDPKKSHPRDLFKLFFMLLEILAIEDDNASIAGVAWVIDARDVTMEQMLQYEPFLLKKTWMLVSHCLPLRFTEVHMINMRKDGQAIFNFVTTFLPKSMPFKFIVHTKAEDLYVHLPRSVMTVEYGGYNGYQAEALDAWDQKLKDYTNHFADDASYGTNEKYREGLKNRWGDGELSGTNGSFRKLEVD